MLRADLPADLLCVSGTLRSPDLEVSICSLRSHLIKINPSRNILDPEKAAALALADSKDSSHLGDPIPRLAAT
jgi:hypothetical protein